MIGRCWVRLRITAGTPPAVDDARAGQVYRLRMKTRARAIRRGLPRDITAQAVALLFASSAAMLAGAQTPTATQPDEPTFIGRAPFTDRLNPPAYEQMGTLPREQFDLGKAVFNTCLLYTSDAADE